METDFYSGLGGVFKLLVNLYFLAFFMADLTLLILIKVQLHSGVKQLLIIGQTALLKEPFRYSLVQSV